MSLYDKTKNISCESGFELTGIFIYVSRVTSTELYTQKQEVFFKKGKIPVLVSLFTNVAALRPATSLKKRLRHTCFPVNFVKFLKELRNHNGKLFYRPPQK